MKKKFCFGIVLVIMCLSVIGCGKKEYKANEKLTNFCENDICQINLNYLLSYQESINKLSKMDANEYFDSDEYFGTDEIEKFNKISNEYWNESKDRLLIFTDFGVLSYMVALERTNVFEYSTDTNNIETKVRFPSVEEKNRFCEGMNSNIDNLLSTYYTEN